LNTVKLLLDNGYFIKGRHYRRLEGVAVEIADPGKPVTFDTVMTRHDFELAQADGKLVWRGERPFGFPQLSMIPFGQVVSAKGGFTSVTVVRPDGTELHGKYNFGKNEPFWRRLGFQRAVGIAAREEIRRLRNPNWQPKTAAKAAADPS